MDLDSSRKVPSGIILKCYDWAIEQRDKNICVMSGFHSKIEKDVFHFLAKGKQPIIIVLARSMYKNVPVDFKVLLKQNRLLIISPFDPEVKRVTEETAEIRNKYIIENSDELYIPYKSESGLLSKSIENKMNI